ncbi:hypothetical protein SAMN05660297_00062 [Natronincola peptidivorans]|uniref:Uncharacterized protein n=1 Tax=Natronincola peptidivorans TaxID=426128 RepID=A0A1H9Y685_9FIRM|nr:hypothetical protein [Natronincola peptidivorans]SES64401.1 hypothetical protein SAMN05660297_00062 [Natronincola peptidivorans]
MKNKKLLLTICIFLILAMTISGCRPAERPVPDPVPQETQPGVRDPVAPAPGQPAEPITPREPREAIPEGDVRTPEEDPTVPRDMPPRQ